MHFGICEKNVGKTKEGRWMGRCCRNAQMPPLKGCHMVLCSHGAWRRFHLLRWQQPSPYFTLSLPPSNRGSLCEQSAPPVYTPQPAHPELAQPTTVTVPACISEHTHCIIMASHSPLPQFPTYLPILRVAHNVNRHPTFLCICQVCQVLVFKSSNHININTCQNPSYDHFDWLCLHHSYCCQQLSEYHWY